jgi:hypothetical protein
MRARDPFATARRLLLLVAPLLLGLARAGGAAEADSVTGSITVGGKTYNLEHVYARRQPNPSEKTQTVLVVLMTDKEVPKNVLDDKYRLELTDLARDGKFHGVSVTIGLDKKPAATGWTYAKELGGAIVNRADQHTFAPTRFDDLRVEGKLSGRGTFGDDKWEYTAAFQATPSAMK